jgi:hypothetical protein
MSKTTTTDLKSTLSPERSEISMRLHEKAWFNNTDKSIKEEILSLPEDFNPALFDLSERPNEIGNLEVLKIQRLVFGSYYAILIFKVRSSTNNQEFDYEYVISKYGKNPGFKGIIFVEVEGKIQYFLIKRVPRFPLGYTSYDSIGGFIQFQNNKLINLPSKIEEEIKRQLGLKDLVVKRFIDLGQMHTDTAMTNTHVSLFAAVISGNEVKKLEAIINKPFKTKTISFELLIEPIEKLREYIHKVDDSYFHTCVTRLLSMGIINI